MTGFKEHHKEVSERVRDMFMNTKINLIEGDKTKKQRITQGKTSRDTNIIHLQHTLT